MLLEVLMESVAGPLGRSKGSPKHLVQSERSRKKGIERER